MSDWAIGQGFLGLKSTVDKRESAKEELGVLEALKNQMRQDKADKEADSLKMQAYEAEVSKFADTLLAPDRNRINEKSKILSMKVREHVKTHGGDMGKFFENGGHQVLGDYKSSLVNSQESSTYLDNKKNMEQIIKIQDKGLGHLINPTDLANLKQYQKTGEGVISYTGIMNEIEVPDPNKYEYGQPIPPQDILFNKANFTKIYGNYVLTHPNSPPPTQQDLLAFTSSHYMDKGANWQKTHAETTERNNHIETMTQISSHEKIEAAKLQTEIEKEKIKAIVDMSAGSAKGAGGGGGEADLGPNSKGYKSQYTSDVAQVYSNVPKSGLTVKDFQQGWWNKYEYQGLAKNTLGEDFIISSEDYADDGDGNRFSAFAAGYQPRNSKRLRLDANAALYAATNGSIKAENGIIKDLLITPELDWFDAGGRKISSYGSKNGFFSEALDFVDPTGVFGKDYFSDNDKPRNFKVLGPITMGVATTADGKENMIMNIVDGKGSTSIDKKETADYDKLLADSEITMKAAIAIQSEDGHTFYIPFDPTVSKVQSDIDAYDKGNDTTDEKESYYQRNTEQKVSASSVAQNKAKLEGFWNSAIGDRGSASSIYSESNMVGPSNQPMYRTKLIQSMYGAMATLSGDTSLYQNGASQQMFMEAINEAISEGYTTIREDLANPSISNDEIIARMKKYDSNGQDDFYSTWKVNHDYLMRK